jgi:hypothetical protein
MPYSLNSKCAICARKGKCTDKHFIEGAISGIHSVWPSEKGHLGSGSIILDCQNFVEKE